MPATRYPIVLKAPVAGPAVFNVYENDGSTARTLYAGATGSSTTSAPVTVAAGGSTTVYVDEGMSPLKVSAVVDGYENADGNGAVKALSPTGAGNTVQPTLPSSAANRPQAGRVVASATTIVCDAKTDRMIVLNTLAHNVGTLTLNNPFDGAEIVFVIKQDATGSRLWTWGAGVLGGPTLTTTASKTDVVTLKYSASLAKWVTKSSTLNQ